MAELVGKRYASSLFEVGLELENIEEFHSQLQFIKETLISEEKLLQILEHPRIAKDEKRKLVESIFKKNISREVLNFLYVIIDKKRESSIMDIVKEYNTLFKEYKNILDIEAVTAVKMEKSSKKRLQAVLKDKFHKEVRLSNLVDPSIIGGVLLRMDEKIIDSSIKGQLREMESMIKDVSL